MAASHAGGNERQTEQLLSALEAIEEVHEEKKKELPMNPRSTIEQVAAARKASWSFKQILQTIRKELGMEKCLHMGDIKHIRGVLRKLKAKRMVHDLLRATYTISDDEQLKKLMAAVHKHFDVVTLDNKFKSRKETEPPCLHLKLRFKELPPQLQSVVTREAWVMELQLTTPEILKYKATHCHPVYELWRNGPFPRVCPACGMCPNLVASKEVEKKSTIADGVEKGTWRGNEIAMKTLAYNKEQVEIYRRKFLGEVNCHAKLDHHHIAQLLGVIDEDDRLAILTELGDKGTLKDKLGGLSKKDKIRIALQICDALIYLHRNAVVHSDLKSANVFLRTYYGGLWALLGDFGLAQKLKSITKGGIDCGTIPYMSPEAHGFKFTKKGKFVEGDKSATDVWSFGCLLIEMFAEGEKERKKKPEDRPLWHTFTDAEIQKKVTGKELPPELARVRHPLINALVRKCLSFEPKDRPSMEEVRVTLRQLVPKCVNIFLRDTSPSMRWRMAWGFAAECRDVRANEVILYYADGLLGTPNQEICLYTFDEKLNSCSLPRMELNPDSRKQLDSKLKLLSCRRVGSTNLYGALAQLLLELPTDCVARLFVLSDGCDNLGRSKDVQSKLKTQFEQLITGSGELGKKLVGVRTFSVGTPEETKALNDQLALLGLPPAVQLAEKTKQGEKPAEAQAMPLIVEEAICLVHDDESVKAQRPIEAKEEGEGDGGNGHSQSAPATEKQSAEPVTIHIIDDEETCRVLAHLAQRATRSITPLHCLKKATTDKDMELRWRVERRKQEEDDEERAATAFMKAAESS